MLIKAYKKGHFLVIDIEGDRQKSIPRDSYEVIKYTGTDKIAIKDVLSKFEYCESYSNILDINNEVYGNTQNETFEALLRIFEPFDSLDIGSINGRSAGTFFGDDFVVTKRTPINSAKWSQGIPVYSAEIEIIGTGRWYIPQDLNAPAYADGVSVFETGISPDAKVFITDKTVNRYQPGHLSYYGYTVAIEGYNESDGDFVALFGAFQRGSFSLVQNNEIKEAICWGVVRQNGIIKKVLRIYKNFNIVLEKEINISDSKLKNLNIYEQQIGFYGIHPSIIYLFNQEKKKNELIDYTSFAQKYTHVQDPNMAIGTYLENKGNTKNIKIYNGSFEYGNYSDYNNNKDASARVILDYNKIDTIAVDADYTDGSGLIAAYRVTDLFNSSDSISSSGVTYKNFVSRIENELIELQATCTASKPIFLVVNIIPASDIVATFTDVKQHISVLQKSINGDITSVNFANSNTVLIMNIATSSSIPASSNINIIEKTKPRLTIGSVAVISLYSTKSVTVTDFACNLTTKDLF